MPDATPTSLYRYYDRRGILLYVGVTGRAATRNHEHNLTKSWWPHVHRQDVEHYPTRGAALAAEVEAIRRYRPPFNTQHNPGHEQTRAAYEAVTAADVPIPAFADFAVTGPSKRRLPLSVNRSADLVILSTVDRIVPLIDVTDIRAIHVSNGSLIDIRIDGHTLQARAKVRRSIELTRAELMFKHLPYGRLGIKRVDLIGSGR